jgi:hypothetical protein
MAASSTIHWNGDRDLKTGRGGSPAVPGHPFRVGLILIVISTVLGLAGGRPRFEAIGFVRAAQAEPAAEVSQMVSSFCLEGEIMQQLLEGFGSRILVEAVAGKHLNCDARVLREESDGVRALLDVELECECEESEHPAEEPMRFDGTWRISIRTD